MSAHIAALNKAKIQLMSKPDTVFFTTVCFSLKHIWDETVPTACTNGKEIRFNPDFFMSLDLEEQIFLLVHESMHVAYMHMDRLNTRNPRKWNYAADYVINHQLISRGFKMPKNGLHDPQYADMSTEEVYNKLPDDLEIDMDLDLRPSEGDADQLTRDIQDILVRASMASKMAGNAPGSIPGDIQIFLNRLLDPKLPWFRILQRYMQKMAKTGYSFKKPNRRFFPKHYLPSLYGEALMDIAVAVDTSGSVSDADFNRFVSEVHSILKMVKPDKLTLVQFDTEIKSVTPLRNVHDLSRCKFEGRGGTRISPVFQWANENKPQLLLIFTDGEFRFYEYETTAPLIWVIHNNEGFTAPKGKVIHYSI